MKVLPRRRRAVLLNSVLGVALLAGAGLAYATVNSDAAASGRSGQTRTTTVAKGTVLATVSGSGTLVSPTDAGADFVTGGRLTEVDVQVGDKVKKGQVLAKVSTTAAQQQVDQAQAALDAAQAQLTKAEEGQTVTTTSSGGQGGRSGQAAAPAPSPSVTVDASAVAQAQEQVTQAENSLSDAEAALAGTVLKAPVSGTVASVGGAVGDTVSGTGTGASSGSGGSSGSSGQGGSSGSSSSASSSSTPSGFVVITNPSGMQVSANFSETDALKIKKGQAATVTLNAKSDTQLNAKVLFISSLPSSSGSSGSGSGSAVQYAARLQITGDTGSLRTGMTATVSVVTGEADNALYVPTNALSGTGTSRTATVVAADGSAERRTVQVGLEGDSEVQVTSGLTQGEQVELTSTTSTGSNGFPSGTFPGLGGGAGARFGGAGGGFGGGFGGGGFRSGQGRTAGGGRG